VFKTLVVSLNGKELAVAVLPISEQLYMKLMARAIGGKRVEMADKTALQRTTGYVLGGISPLGQKRRPCTVIDNDNSACDHETIFVSAGRRGPEIELAAEDLRRLTDGSFAALAHGVKSGV
jgi:Cys-tRNA(Pro)/Cys-tRNA(Cys) deacylase